MLLGATKKKKKKKKCSEGIVFNQQEVLVDVTDTLYYGMKDPCNCSNIFH